MSEEVKKYRNNYLEGEKIGNLTFVRRDELSPNGSPQAYFLCDCGKEFITRIQTAKSNKIKSCGCKSNEFRTIASTKYAPPERTESGIKKIPILTQELLNRFLGKIKNTGNINDCWEWQAGTSAAGYGIFNVGETDYISTRISYSLHYKQDPLELCVLHKCDNPKCCNPHHLFLGTKSDNMKDMADKGRSNKGEAVNTNKLTEEQVKYIRLAYATGAMNKSELAREFGVYHSNIISIVNNKTWKHI